MDKEAVIAEIKRTAAANGGQAPGREKFEKESGLKVQKFIGRYWRTWSDALTEAGFAPNSLQSSYDPKFICQKLAELTRHLGKFPAHVDLVMRAREDDTFPSHGVFTRLGESKSKRVATLLAYCKSDAEYSDLVPLLEKVPSKGEPSDNSALRDQPEGYVYLLKSGKFYKIGRTSSVERRSREISIQLPEDMTTVHIMKTDDPAGIENYWHRRFADRRKNGEWFELSRNDVAAFCRRKFM